MQHVIIFFKWKCFLTLRDIPYYKMVEAMGGYGELVENPDDIVHALKRSFDSGLPSLMDVVSKAE